jgi:hypothetical protein
MISEIRNFESELDGFKITGTVTQPVPSGKCDYYVQAQIKTKCAEHGRSIWNFRMIRLLQQDCWSVTVVDNVLATGILQTRLYMKASGTDLGAVFEEALKRCLKHHKLFFEDTP